MLLLFYIRDGPELARWPYGECIFLLEECLLASFFYFLSWIRKESRLNGRFMATLYSSFCWKLVLYCTSWCCDSLVRELLGRPGRCVNEDEAKTPAAASLLVANSLPLCYLSVEWPSIAFKSLLWASGGVTVPATVGVSTMYWSSNICGDLGLSIWTSSLFSSSVADYSSYTALSLSSYLLSWLKSNFAFYF